jgi:formylglycine-generating enzyme required for sulfatase activity
LPRDHLLDLFDSSDEQPVVVRTIANFLLQTRTKLEVKGGALSDVIFYYVGHGGFDTSGSSAYFLAIRHTNAVDYLASSLAIASLRRALREHTRGARHYLILDCCFAAAALGPYVSLSATAQAMVAQVQDAFPPTGTAMLCASGAVVPARAKRGATFTMFSEALFDVLYKGVANSPSTLSLSELGIAIRSLLKSRYGDEAVRPEVHSPEQSGDSVAEVPIFRNAFVKTESVIPVPKEIIINQIGNSGAPVQRDEAHEVLDVLVTARQPNQIRDRETEANGGSRRDGRTWSRRWKMAAGAASLMAALIGVYQLAVHLSVPPTPAAVRLEASGADESNKEIEPRRVTEADGPLKVADSPLKVGQVFRDRLTSGQPCLACPEMVVVPAGQFRMGSPTDEDSHAVEEEPQHLVTFEKPFAVGRFSVTFEEWDACVAEKGCAGYRPDDRKWGRGRLPVINISWKDAIGYVAWLQKKTGAKYRLLTDAEREYVTRADTTTPFWWGSSISTKQANYDGKRTYGGGPKGEYRARTVVVDSFAPNPWGLYQVHGNLWEWVEDCWNSNHLGAPTNGSARLDGDCNMRIVRGGSWDSYPDLLRSASRVPYKWELRAHIIGVRIARTL